MVIFLKFRRRIALFNKILMILPLESYNIFCYTVGIDRGEKKRRTTSDMSKNTILVCDDEPDIVSALKIYLSSEGYEVLTAENGQEALGVMNSNPGVQLILMDIMMPVMDGITAMSKIREICNVPIILLTAKGEDTDKVLGLTVGADDYVTKPFNPVELIARVKSQLRRYTQLGSMSGEPKPETGTVSLGGFVMDDRAHSVTLDGEPLTLTPTEYDILRLFLHHPGEVLSPKEIYRRVWQDEPFGADSTVAVHIRHLREKIEIDPANPRYLKVVWAQGYKFDCGGGSK